MNHKLAVKNLKLLCQCFAVFETDYWLSCGTLLGIVRDGHLIEHDEDVDVCVNIDTFNIHLYKMLLDSGFELYTQYGIVSDGFEITLLKDNIRFDLFFFYKKENNWYHSVWKHYKSNLFLKTDYVFQPFQTTFFEFEEFMFKIPENYEYYLEQQYGPKWSTPTKRWSYDKSPFNLRKTDVLVSTIQSKSELLEFMKSAQKNPHI